MATGALDTNGIWQYGEDDSEATFSALLNKVASSTSTQVGVLKQTGRVVQVVNATYSTGVASSSSTYADTGLTATITPKYSTSKILVIVDQAGLNKGSGNTFIGLKLLRNSTLLKQIDTYAAAIIQGGTVQEANIGGVGINYLDSPATTSATTYKTQFNSGGNVASTAVQYANGATSSITLMEVTA